MVQHDLDPLDSQSVIVDSPLATRPEESASEPLEGPGLMLESLNPGTRIVVATKHSCYRFVVIDGAEKRASVTGGKMFPESTEVRIEGATTGNNVIKPGRSVAGLRMELSRGLRRITTSPVQSLSVESEAA